MLGTVPVSTGYQKKRDAAMVLLAQYTKREDCNVLIQKETIELEKKKTGNNKTEYFNVACIFCRLQDWRSDQSVSSDRGILPKNESLLTLLINLFKSTFEFFRNFRYYDDPPTKSTLNEPRPKKKQVLDPQGPFLEKWDKIFIISCVAAVSVDPLFLYIPVIDGDKYCLKLDRSLEIVASILRSFTDLFYILHIIFQFRTAFIAPSSTVVGRGVLVEDTSAIAKRYLSTFFLVDVFAVLPLPQVGLHIRSSLL